MQVLADGKILVVGYASNGGNGTDIAIARYNADGSLDATFGSGTGRVMSGGSAKTTPSVWRFNLMEKLLSEVQPPMISGSASFNADGSIDTRFG